MWFGLDDCGGIGWLCVVYCRGQWDGHDAKCLRLEELHGSPDIFFHELSHLLFCPIVWPLLPSCLIPSTFACILLKHVQNDARLKKNETTNKVNGEERCKNIFDFLHIVTSRDDIGMSVTRGATAPAPPNLLMLKTWKALIIKADKGISVCSKSFNILGLCNNPKPFNCRMHLLYKSFHTA